MKKACLLLLTLTFCSAILHAQNHMDLIATITGDFYGALLGVGLASLDFNGDGIKDLAIQESNWNPTGSYDPLQRYGRINLYWGGVDFDTIPDFSIFGSADLLLNYGYCEIINAGDVNNDGIEDLAVTAKSGSSRKAMIFFGRQQPVETPDVMFQFPYPCGIKLRWIGDINADGYDDIGLIMGYDFDQQVKVILGGSFTMGELYNINSHEAIMISGIGDVNGDGVSDYHIKYPLVSTDWSQNRLSVHFGSYTFPELDSVVICPNTNSYVQDYAAALGDVNGDGIDDFTSFIYENAKVWFGGPDITTQWDVLLTESVYTTKGEIVSHGDFNNDGYEDIVGASRGYHFDTGISWIWLGGSSFNGTVDLVIPAQPGVFEQFGFAKATGDFNNDGYCDVAISQPWHQAGEITTPGKVFVFAGNAQLEDTTVANDDYINPAQDNDLWGITVYPNPIPKGNVTLNICFQGAGYSKTNGNLKAVLYNIKGQIIDSYKIPGSDIRRKIWTHTLKKCPAGEYLIAVLDGSKRLITHKFTIK
ncbi:MAG: VCBS repeat-containing protein [Candidatus Syntrophosphaera sp.]|nr:VCBS repeat-containing protein [Candidatus Syntrophosphaera sp.]